MFDRIKKGWQSLKSASLAVLGLAVAASSAVVAPQASAAVDAEVITAIEGALTDVNTIGAAVLIVIVGIAVWKWARRAL